jgi:hypothetical protein
MSSVNLEGLHALHEQASANGTLNAWSRIALEWATEADAEIERLRQTPQRDSRRELAERILLQLLAVSPAIYQLERDGPTLLEGGPQLAWSIADAFLRAENRNTAYPPIEEKQT